MGTFHANYLYLYVMCLNGVVRERLSSSSCHLRARLLAGTYPALASPRPALNLARQAWGVSVGGTILQNGLRTRLPAELLAPVMCSRPFKGLNGTTFLCLNSD